MKRFLILLAIKEMPIKTMIRHPDTPIRTTKIQNIDNTKC